MTLNKAVRLIERVAMAQPSVNMIVRNDVFRLNTYADARYGVFAWLQNQHIAQLGSDLMTYQFTFFYVDRLVPDKSNELEIQGTGIRTINNIVSTLEKYGLYASSDVTFQTFNQRFEDECAGVFASVSFESTKADVCSEQFVDFNDDFNEDFLII